MGRKSSDDMFNPNALAPYLRPSSGSALASLTRTHPLSKAERKSVEELHKQLLVIAENEQKTQEAQRALGGLRESAVESFVETAEHIWAVKQAVGRDSGVQGYIDHFSDQTIRAAGTYIHEATGAGSDAILREVGRSLYFATEEERKGFLARIFGDDE